MNQPVHPPNVVPDAMPHAPANAIASAGANARPNAPPNAMTVDVEDYFQVYAFFHCIPRDSWDRYACRVEANVDRILAQFTAAGVSATFFTLGWIAERHKAMVRRIVDAGHELASHGYDHQRVDRMNPAAFREDLRRTRAILEDAGGTAVLGYRAPTFSIGVTTPWAFDLIAEAGHLYSSSVNPVQHDNYGMPDAPRVPYRPAGTDLWEFPMTTARLLGRNLPCSGGGYFRLLPYALFRHGFAGATAGERRPGIFYFHPWEVDPDQPRVPACGWKSRFRHYTNLSGMSAKLDRLLADFAWDRMDRVFAAELASRPAGTPTADTLTAVVATAGALTADAAAAGRPTTGAAGARTAGAASTTRADVTA
jgi:polysaccharide deacetylase family protein (PEP-CTERM system associated)